MQSITDMSYLLACLSYTPNHHQQQQNPVLKKTRQQITDVIRPDLHIITE